MATISRRNMMIGSAALLGMPQAAVARSKSPLLLPHGGGETTTSYYNDLKKAAGGKRGMLIFPYSLPEVGRVVAREIKFWQNFGWRNMDVLNISDPEIARRQCEWADLYWFPGGLQKHQVLTMSRVPGLVKTMLANHANGAVVAGSSAGAAVMTKLMISGGKNGAVYTRAGFGFLDGVVFDQHVKQRNREYRLHKVIAANRRKIGVGLDEATWANVQDGIVRARGRGRVHIVTWDGGVRVLKLRSGQRFDLAKRAKI